MENKSATKTPKTERAWTKSGRGQNQEADKIRRRTERGRLEQKEPVTIRGADTIRGEQKGTQTKRDRPEDQSL